MCEFRGSRTSVAVGKANRVRVEVEADFAAAVVAAVGCAGFT